MTHQNIIQVFLDESYSQEAVFEFPLLLLLALIALSLVMLSKGADWMIDGVVALAQRTGLPRIVIGATIISVATTTPEAFVSVMAAWCGNPGLALGNGVGSIIADTGLIFGLTGCLTTVPMNRFIINRTGWVQVSVATLLVVISVILLFSTDTPPVLGRWVGCLFLVLPGGYLFATYVWANKGASIEADDIRVENSVTLGRTWIMILCGLSPLESGKY
jgi:cation:H+ antiporter